MNYMDKYTKILDDMHKAGSYIADSDTDMRNAFENGYLKSKLKEALYEMEKPREEIAMTNGK